MARYRFPPRAYGPFTEDSVLGKGAKGRHRYGVDGAGVPYDITDQPTWRQSQVRVYRSGTRRRKPSPLSPSAFNLLRENHGCEGYVKAQYPPPYSYQYDMMDGALCDLFVDPVPDTSDAGLLARTEIAALLKLKNQSVNLGVAFAERSRTASLVGDSILSIVNDIRAFRRGDLRRALRRFSRIDRNGARRALRSQNLTNQWLALQYGWTPLLSDVYGSCEALANREIQDYAVRVAARKGTSSTVYTTKVVGYDVFDVSVKTDLSYHVALNYTPTEALIRRFTSLGLTNPLEIAWELVPFSFVADWFVPIGSWLSSLDAANGWNYANGTKTRRLVCRRDVRHKDSVAYGTKYTGTFTGYRERKVVDRALYASSPIPGRPGMKDPRSLKHMANAMSLLVGLFSGSKSLRGLSAM